jgi:hypothetical protein
MATTTNKQDMYHTFNTQFAEQLSIIKNSITDNTLYYVTDDTNLCIRLGKDQGIVASCQTNFEYSVLLSYVKYLHAYYQSDVSERQIFDDIYDRLVTQNIYITSSFYQSDNKGDRIQLKFSNKETYILSDDGDLYKLNKSLKFIRSFSINIDSFNELYNFKCIANTHNITPYIINNKNQYDNQVILDIIDINNTFKQYKIEFSNKNYGRHILDYINKSQ